MLLEDKLSAFDAEVEEAFTSYVTGILKRKAEIVALARRRHVWGHHEYGDGLLFELDPAELAGERDQESADGIVYEMVLRRKAAALAGLQSVPSTEPREAPNGM